MLLCSKNRVNRKLLIPVGARQAVVDTASRCSYGLGEIVEFTGLLRLPGVAVLLFGATQKICGHQSMGWRIILPVGKEFIDVPKGELVDLREGPPGSGCDMTVDERPVGYTGTGVGSPAEAFLSPETSSTALKSALKSSMVRPFSS
jgi:hypothetical protein